MKRFKAFIAAVIIALAACLCTACADTAQSDGGDDNTPIETPIIPAS